MPTNKSVTHSALGDQTEQKQVNIHFDKSSKFWSDLYSHENVFGVIHQERRQIALKYFDSLTLQKESKILEIGCGAGHTSIDLAKRGYMVEATDTVEAMTELTKKNVAVADVSNRIKINVADAHNLPFSNEIFDCVIAMGVIPWLYNPRKALGEIARVTKPGGFVIINTDNRYRINHLVDPIHFPFIKPLKELLKSMLQTLGIRKKTTDAKPLMYTIKEFTKMLQENNMNILKQKNLGFGPFTVFNKNMLSDGLGIMLHKKLQYLSDREYPIIRKTGCQYIVLAEKKM